MSAFVHFAGLSYSTQPLDVNPVDALGAGCALDLAPMQIPDRRPSRVFESVVIAAILALAPASFAVGSGSDEYNYDDSQDIPWIENETEVLAMPNAEDLSPVDLDQMPPGLKLLIDKSRITVNPDDKVVRAWLWVRSEAGAQSGTFEGFRCDTREYKVYAYANPRRDPPVSKAKNPRWKSVPRIPGGNYRGELLQYYFCDIGYTRNAFEIRDQLASPFLRRRFETN